MPRGSSWPRTRKRAEGVGPSRLSQYATDRCVSAHRGQGRWAGTWGSMVPCRPSRQPFPPASAHSGGGWHVPPSSIARHRNLVDAPAAGRRTVLVLLPSASVWKQVLRAAGAGDRTELGARTPGGMLSPSRPTCPDAPLPPVGPEPTTQFNRPGAPVHGRRVTLGISPTVHSQAHSLEALVQRGSDGDRSAYRCLSSGVCRGFCWGGRGRRTSGRELPGSGKCWGKGRRSPENPVTIRGSGVRVGVV